jgi:hypothetical protein
MPDDVPGTLNSVPINIDTNFATIACYSGHIMVDLKISGTRNEEMVDACRFPVLSGGTGGVGHGGGAGTAGTGK